MENTTSAELSAQLDGFFALNLDLLSITDKEHRFVRVNQAWAEFSGIPVQQLVGRCYLDLIHPEDLEETHQGFEKLLRDNELVGFVNRYRCHTAEYRSLEWTARQVGDLIYSVARDITSHLEHEEALRTALALQKSMNEEIVRLNREIEYFVAKLSHDVRTAVHSIIGFNRMLLDSDLSHNQLRYANLIKNSGEFLYSLVRNVLDFSSIQAGKVEVRQISFSLKDLIDSCIATFSLQAEEKELPVYVEVSVCIPPLVQGDPDLLARVLTNIIGNAITNTSQGSVSVLCRMTELNESGLRIALEVSDTGRGIAPEELECIFEPYRQVKPIGADTFQGSGLGLPISRCLIEAMHGSISVTSEVGVGSRFTITLPLALESDWTVSPIEAGCRLPTAILHDTDQIQRQHLAELLGKFGVEVLIADTPHAVSRLSQFLVSQEQSVVQIFFSLDQDDEDMYDEILNLRANGGMKNLIYLMASEFTSARLQRYEPLIDGFLLKPVQAQRLTDLLGAGCGCALSKPQVRIPEVLVRSDAHRILVVDDLRINREIVVYLLEQLGMVADTADDGEQALEMIGGHDYDMVLLDLNLPKLGGAQVVRAVREQEVGQGRRTPIVAMTASVVQGERERCLTIGFDDFLEKPVRSAVMFEVIARWIPNPA
jgi:two-component system, sensor histidine kinase and response regulator